MRIDATTSFSNRIQDSTYRRRDEEKVVATEPKGGIETHKSAKGSERRNEEKDPLQDPAVRQQIAKLQARDAEVRAHEAAHIAAGSGVVAGGASFTYQRGPDGRMYAVGGEVPISLQGSDDPKETVRKMRQVVAAALAPTDPSPQDYAVAATARSEEMKAQQEIRREEMRQLREQAHSAYGENSPQAGEKGEKLDESFSIDITT